MADGAPEERRSIGDINRALKRYGSTCNHVKRTSSMDGGGVVRHEVEHGDTLQGLALKYGTTMEQIRRANRLWASDSVFVRETLLIPVEVVAGATSAGATFSSADSGNSSDSSTPGDDGPSAILRESRPHAAPALHPPPLDQSDSSPSEFLGKIDSAIARTKHQVHKIHSNSLFPGGEGDEGVQQRRRRGPCVSRLRAGADAGDRRLKSSLQKLEQSQDAIFEL